MVFKILLLDQFHPPIALTIAHTVFLMFYNRAVGNTGLFPEGWRNNFTYD